MGAAVIGRDSELAAVEGFLARLDLEPHALVFEGEAGIGKTTVWLEAVARAKAKRCRVFEARPAESEVRLSYGALADLLGNAYDETRSDLPSPQQRALDAALLRSDESVDPRTTATAFVAVLAKLAADGPVVVAIDDVQWLDRASERILEFAARRLPERVGLLLARRGVPDEALPLGLDRALPDDRCKRLQLGPLSLAALHHLIRARLGSTLPRPTLVRLENASGGNPFYALEIARALERDPTTRAPGDPLPLPKTLHELVGGRVRTLSAPALEATLVAAALSRPTAATVASAVDGDAHAALLEAEETGVLVSERERISFAHPLLASAVMASASSAQRRNVHRRLAEVVGDAEERARHLALSTTDPDEAIAAQVEAAAESAARRGAHDAAAELFRSSGQLTPSDQTEPLARRMLGEAVALVETGDLARARTLAETAVDTVQPGPTRARGLEMLAGIAWIDERVVASVDYLDRAAIEAADDHALQASILAGLAAYLVSFDPNQALIRADEAIGLLSAERDPGPLAFMLMVRFFAEALLGHGDSPELLERAAALETGAPYLSAFPLMWFHCIDDLDATRSRSRMEAQWYRERGSSEAEWPERVAYLALTEFRAGNWELAEEYLDQSCSVLEQFDRRAAWAVPFGARALIDAHRGRLERARSTLLPLVEDSERTQNAWWSAHWLSWLGFVEFSAGNSQAAVQVWTRMGEELARIHIKDFLYDRSEPDHIEALVALGDVERARNVLEHLEWRGRTLPRLWITTSLPRARAILLAAEGDVSEAVAALDELDLEANSKLPFELGRTLLVAGQVRRRAKERRAAADALERAVAIFEELGAPLWAERAAAELRRVPIRRKSPAELTESEERVAELAATGKTNKEVAQALFISPKTVEANLSRIYQKLGIRSRAQLGARMAERGEREGAAKT